MDTTYAPGTCVVCGAQATLHMTEVYDGVRAERGYCRDHIPAVLQSVLPKTPAEEADVLRKLLAAIDEDVQDPAARAEMRAEIESEIAEIEAGRRRL